MGLSPSEDNAEAAHGHNLQIHDVRKMFAAAVAAVDVGEKIARLIPNAKFALMTECGHWPQFEDPPTFNKIHLDFLLGRS